MENSLGDDNAPINVESTLILTSGQIAFPATATPSSDPNTLDDYEEGTYTAIMTCATSGTITLGVGQDLMSYTKIGRHVTVTGKGTVASVSSPDGTARFSVPFTNASEIEDEHRGSFPVLSNVNYPSGAWLIGSYVAGTNYVYFQACGDNIEPVAISTEIIAADFFQFTATYFTD